MIAPLTIVSLWEIMNTVYVGTMFEALLNAGTLADNANAAIVAKQPLYIPESHYAEFMRHMVLLEKAGNELAMPVIARHAYIVKGALEKAAVDGLDRRIDFRELVEMRTSASQLRSNSPIELHAQKFLSLSRADAMLFDGVDEWGGDVVARFKSARYDIHEGAKCLGLGRSTASVFHFIRVLETGLRALRAHVGVVAPLVGAERNWGVMCNAIKAKINTLSHGDDREELNGIFMCLHAAKDCYRDNTMHMDKRYGDGKASDIHFAVRALMQKIAVRMDENGNPKI